MAARLKSSVLKREERGVGSVTMGRLIACAMLGGASFMAMQLLGLRLLMIPGGLGGFIMALFLTSLRHGIPLYRHLTIILRARLMVAALTDAASWQGQTVSFFDLDPDTLRLDTVRLLAAPAIVEEGTLDEWEIVADSRSTDGFEVVLDTLSLEASL
jgi:hypothetical protein